MLLTYCITIVIIGILALYIIHIKQLNTYKMKKITFYLILAFVSNITLAQWTPVNNGLPDYPPTTIINWVDTMVVSTYGGGIFLTYDQGENWTEMPGTLPNLFVNRIDYRGGQFDPISVSTDGGPFISVNGGYIDCNGTGLTNNNVNFWSGAGEGWDLVGDAVVGSNGDGIFAAQYTSPFIYDWSPSNAGISGDGLLVNYGLIAETFALLATEGGAYYALFGDTEWTLSSDGLSGDALKVNHITYIGFYLISTDGGLYYAMDLTDTWQPVMDGEKFNVAYYINTDISPSGFLCFAFGENGYSTEDFITWNQMDFGGMEGEVTAAQSDSVNLYVGFTVRKKNGRDNGGLYSRPMEQLLVGIENYLEVSTGTVLNQNFPNPFSGTTRISYSIEKSEFVTLNVYDNYGRHLKTLVNNYQTKGNYTIDFEANNLPSGIYNYTIQTRNSAIKSRMMIILK